MMGREQLEAERLRLNHDLLKNLFLNRLGSARSDHSVEERSRLVTWFWSLSSRENDLENGADAVKETVTRGLEAWPKVRDALVKFFRDGPERHGYCRTELFIEASKRCVDGERSLVNTISRFVSEFTAVGLSPQNERLRRLQEFWDAADEIARILSGMRPGFGEEARFGDFFQRGESGGSQ